MASKGPLELEFKYDTAGKDLLVYLVCSGIATGAYSCLFRRADDSTLTKEGNIEKPERYNFPATEGLASIKVTVKSKPFFADDPGTYRLVFQQEGAREQQSPELVDDAELTVNLTRA